MIFAQSLDNSRESIEKLYSYLLEVFGLERPPERDFQRNGKLITIDGHSGAGKDTQMQMLKEDMQKDDSYKNHNIITLIQKREDPFRQVAKYLWKYHELLSNGDCSFLLLTAGRKYFVHNSVLPQLEDPIDIIIQNRSYLSQIAYHAENVSELPNLLKLSDFDPKADLAFILECEIEIAYERIKRRSPEKGGIIYPNERPEYIARVKENFEKLAEHVNDLIFIETSGDPNSIAKKIKQKVDAYFKQRK